MLRILDDAALPTVCESARCPNRDACWQERTATFLLMGDVCTRACRFCSIRTSFRGTPLDASEPDRTAFAARALGLRHCVLTSVDRDDLDDAGAHHLAACVRAVVSTGATVELLAPDFGGDAALLDVVLAAGPHVLGHNIETVERLTPLVRDRRASYERSIVLLDHAKRAAPDVVTKTSIMLGLDETDPELDDAFADLAEADVDILTIGQYLRPTSLPRHVPVMRYIEPSAFANLAARARARGISTVAAGPLIRSSFRAAALYDAAKRNRAP